MAERRRPWLLLMLALSLVLAGCGISSTGTVDEGDGLESSTGIDDSEVQPPPSPDTALSAEGLVQDFLRAASGGQAQVKLFLTENGLKTWAPATMENPPLTVVRLLNPPQAAVVAPDGRTPITVNFQVVGTLNDLGRVDELQDLTPRKPMIFWVVQDPDKHSQRIDEIDNPIEGGGLLLSDQTLSDPTLNLYRIQPMYFWDSANNNAVLVPDLRYLPLTITAGERASRVVQFLIGGPSKYLTGLVGVPPGTFASEPVTSLNGTLVIKLTPEAAARGDDALKRLLYQIQWSLRSSNTTPTIALQVDDKTVNVNARPSDFVPYNLSSTFQSAPQRYDINAGKVVLVPATTPPPQGVLAAPENQNVQSAAVSRRGDVAAFVTTDQNGRRTVYIVHANGSKVSATLGTGNVGRPAFTSSNGDLLVPANGKLLAVSADGTVSEALKNVSGVTAVSVAPDGRRVAFVVNGQPYVSSLTAVHSVSPPQRSILTGQLAATSVAWTSEAWLLVTGTTVNAPVLWQVTADGVAADNQSGKLLSLTVNELLAYPQWPARTANTDVFAITAGRGAYSLFGTLQPEQQMASPFFGS